MNEKEEKIQDEEVKEEEIKEEKKSKANPLEEKVKELEKKLAEANQKYEDADKSSDKWKNKYYQVYADMANTRKQVEKENADFKQYAIKSFIEELIPSLDGFDMALKVEPTDEKLINYLKGFEMIHSKLLNVLKQAGVEVVDPQKGDEYDPNKMQAFDTVEGEADNKVADVFTKGYMLKGHMLRPAGVIVTKKKDEPVDIPVTDEEEKKEDTKEDMVEEESK
jgi:molecular chaperone GrpE